MPREDKVIYQFADCISVLINSAYCKSVYDPILELKISGRKDNTDCTLSRSISLINEVIMKNTK
jgi:hypothetical protein